MDGHDSAECGNDRPNGDRQRGDRPNGRAEREPHAKARGRQADPTALAEVRALLGGRPRRRDLLIEHLHLIQDAYHGLRAHHLTALAKEMRLPLAVVQETASFYAHFDVIPDGALPPPPVTVRVCDSVGCAMQGADRLHAELAGALGAGVRVLKGPCMGRCEKAPVAAVGQNHIVHATAAAVASAVERKQFHPVLPEYLGFDDYVAAGGYALLRDVMAGRRTADEVMSALVTSGLRGLGGAGFPVGQKWRLMAAQPAPRMLAVNGDEGEPGTFKDRVCLESDPHRLLEGILIAARVVDISAIYIYIRDEYPAARAILAQALETVVGAGLSEGREIQLRRGAGAYICGEESAMLESIEGKRGMPRHKPPYPSEVGLFGRPTLIHNVETLFRVRDILERGPEWFSSQGRNGRRGLRSFSVSGRVRNPGVKLAPAGITVRELIDEYCGGMAPGHVFKGYLPGGASGGILPASLDNIPLDFGTLESYGGFIGSAAVIVLSDQDEPRAIVRNLLRFFAHESCGQCTPCRAGTEKAVRLTEGSEWDRALLTELSACMRDASICGLGQAATNPLLSVLKYFPPEG
ncbi:MAG: NADH-ubiquinone oxidoreductase-F iron-sulfur binding region domain-containing protein [Rhodospirillaceae bacterium]